MILAVALACAGLLAPDASRSQREEQALLRAVPELDREFAWHLCSDDTAAWRVYGRRLGPGPLMAQNEALQAGLSRLSFPEFARRRRVLESDILRVGEVLEQEFDCPITAWYARRHIRLSDRDDFLWRQLTVQLIRTLTDKAFTPRARLAALDAIIARYRRSDDGAGIESAQMAAAQIELEVGNPARFRARLEAAMSQAVRLNDHFVACQILGQLGIQHRLAGQPDSMSVCLAQGLALASAHHFTDQAARLLLFDAQEQIETGHMALAADRLTEASELVEGSGGRAVRVRLTLRQAALLADLGWWDLVERSLRRLPVLLRESGGQMGAQESLKHVYDADLLRARTDFARGRMDAGERVLGSWRRAMPVWNRRVGIAQVLDVWSAGLIRSGRWAEAEGICSQGLAHCDSAHVVQGAVAMALRRARALEALGRLAEAQAAATDAARRVFATDHAGDASERAALMVLRARLRLRAGERAGGLALLRTAFAALDRRSQRQDADLLDAALATGLSLRETVHELAGLSPAAGYGFELEWRSLGRRSAVDGAGHDDPFAARRHEGPGEQVVFYFMPDRLLRWTAIDRGVTRDALSVRADSCLADVRQAESLLRTETPVAGRWLGARTEPLMERLGRDLLPRGLGEARGGPARLEISPDGPLLALPFEALQVAGPHGPRPLAVVADVCYQAGWSARSRRASGPTVVVSNPQIPARLRRQFAWSGTLAGSDAESRCACERWPDAIVLSGQQATRSRFMRAASHASNLYIASHHVRDPGAPFLAFIPLAAESAAGPSAPLIEAEDIHALDLTGCALAVLASCASGAPDRVSEQPGPSLGDAFLDAGAHSVVRSFWEVGDEETRDFMAHFLAAGRRGDDPVRALNDARREAMGAAAGGGAGAGVPPRVWAAWSVAESRAAKRSVH